MRRMPSGVILQLCRLEVRRRRPGRQRLQLQYRRIQAFKLSAWMVRNYENCPCTVAATTPHSAPPPAQPRPHHLQRDYTAFSI